MQLHEAKSHTLFRSKKRVGRGGKRGKTSGRGTKGQKARAGRKIRPQIRDIIKKIHKRRGYGRNRSRSINPRNVKPQVVNLGDLNKKLKDGEVVTKELLIERGLIEFNGPVKILGGGRLTKKLSFDKNLIMSESVKKHVEQI